MSAVASAAVAALAAILPIDPGAVLAAIAGIQVATLAQALTASVGLFVAYQAYRGFRRNGSAPMLYLALGVFFVTTVSFVIPTVAVAALGSSDALGVLAWTVAKIVGLAAVFYALTGA